jgi:hypothetical protein
VRVEDWDENRWERDSFETITKWKLNEIRMEEFLAGNEN